MRESDGVLKENYMRMSTKVRPGLYHNAEGGEKANERVNKETDRERDLKRAQVTHKTETNTSFICY